MGYRWRRYWFGFAEYSMPLGAIPHGHHLFFHHSRPDGELLDWKRFVQLKHGDR